MAKENQHELLMHRYWIDKIDYKINPNFQSDNNKVDIKPQFSRAINKVDESKVIVIIEFKTDLETSPFFLNIRINGLFECQGWEGDETGKFLINENTSTILFPYLRQAITTVTGLANVTPLVLPVINTYNLFNNKK